MYINVTFDTNDVWDKVGSRLQVSMNLTPAVDPISYYDNTDATQATASWVWIEPNQRPATLHSRLLEAQDLDINEPQRAWLVRKFTFEVLNLPSVQLSAGADALVSTLLRKQSARQDFYNPASRPALIAGFHPLDSETARFMALNSAATNTWLTAVDLGHGERDQQLYVLFETTDRGVPNPDFVTASWDYIGHFKANLGYFTSEAMVYARVLVVCQAPLSPLMARTLQFLTGQASDARPLPVKDAADLANQLHQLVASGYPLPGGPRPHLDA